MSSPIEYSKRQELPEPPKRHYAFLIYLALLSFAFVKPLYALVALALDSGLYSYILIVPFISAYLVNLRRKQLPRIEASSSVPSLVLAAAGLTALAFGAGWAGSGMSDRSDSLALVIFSYLCLLVGGGFFFLGRRWMSDAAFPIAFLVFMIPLPNHAVEWLENGSKIASAEVASWFFGLSGTPNLRDQFIFRLPNITIEVAPECSGIRSSLVLFMTSLLAANLFLRTFWRRTVLVVLIIPLGFLRNGFRIWTIGQLCVSLGPHMINSPLHKRGGPVFFTLSLVPFFVLIWWLRRGERNRKSPLRSEPALDRVSG